MGFRSLASSSALIALGASSVCAHAAPPVKSLGFDISNVSALPTTGGTPGDITVVSGSCTIDTAAGTFGCAPKNSFAYGQVVESGGGKLGVFVMHSLLVKEAAHLLVRGNLPLVIVATDNVVIEGELTAAPAPRGIYAFAGGAPPAPLHATLGGGHGGGGEQPVLFYGAGGAGYCALGGAGGTGAKVPVGAHGGATYGTANLIPLLGGSSGGATQAGAGGGAIQISARLLVGVGLKGVINAGGGGGQGNSGGGSGGSILLEAPIVTIAGHLSANGGGGGGTAAGGTGGDTGTPSPGGANGGGAGGASEHPAGSPGSAYDAKAGGGEAGSGGGGGAAGRIRVNTGVANMTINGIISPTWTTGCATQGVIAR